MSKSTAQFNQEIASELSNNLARLLKEFAKDFEHRVLLALQELGHDQIRPSHSAVFSNLGLGAVRVTELAERAQVTQQAMGKMLKELERMGYLARDVDSQDKRAREIRLTAAGVKLVKDSVKVLQQVRQEYSEKIGVEELNHLDTALRRVVNKIDLAYMPESWANSN